MKTMVFPYALLVASCLVLVASVWSLRRQDLERVGSWKPVLVFGITLLWGFSIDAIRITDVLFFGGLGGEEWSEWRLLVETTTAANLLASAILFLGRAYWIRKASLEKTRAGGRSDTTPSHS